uniref:Uncharacterized protein n=1 Tax=Acrobeloides nanus TaxID=290746 RepID=A0A914EFS4_9BILA
MLKIFIFLIPLIFLLNEAFGQICPLDDNVVCNSDNKLHRCVCAVPAKTENPVPEQSCNLVVDSSADDFEAVSITFDVKDFEKNDDDEDDDDHKKHKHVTKKDDKDDDDDDDEDKNDDSNEEDEGDDFNQDKFRQEIAKLLHIEEGRILILRISCADEDDKLTVQFVVLRKDVELATVSKGTKSTSDSHDKDDDDDKPRHSPKKNEKDDDDDDDDDKKKGKKDKSDDDDKKGKDNSKDDDEDSDEEDEFVSYKPNDLMNSKKLADDLNSRRTTGTKIADLEVTEVEVVDELVAIEASSDNTFLLFEALAVVFGIVLTCFLGCYFTCKKCKQQDEYMDTLQKV